MLYHKESSPYDSALKRCKNYPDKCDNPYTDKNGYLTENQFTNRKGICRDCRSKISASRYQNKIKPFREVGSQGHDLIKK